MAADDTKPDVGSEPVVSHKPSVAMFLLVLLCVSGLVAAIVLYQHRRSSAEHREQTRRQSEADARIQQEKDRVAKEEADAKRIADETRTAKEAKLNELLAQASRKFAEQLPVKNLTKYELALNSSAALFRSYVETQYGETTSLPIGIEAADMVTRNADVKIVTLSIMTANVTTSSPSSSTGTQLTLVTVAMLAEVRSAQSNKVLWSKELSGRETLLPIQYKNKTEAALVEQVVNTTLRELKPDPELQAVFR